MGTNYIPMIFEDAAYGFFNLFNTQSSFPSTVFIDHEMRVRYKAGFDNNFVSHASDIIEGMLFDMENSLIIASNGIFQLSNDLDADGIVNPGDEVSYIFTIENNSFNADALGLSISLDSNEDVNFTTDSETEFGYLSQGSFINVEVSITIPDTIELGNVDVQLLINSTYIDGDGITQNYNREFVYSFLVTLHQPGYPVTVGSQLKPTAVAVVDIENDGNNDIIIGDYTGLVHRYNEDGSEVIDEVFPYDTGNQIWGSPAAADIDNDGYVDIAITSKSKSLYLFDHNGLKAEYFANSYLMGTLQLVN